MRLSIVQENVLRALAIGWSLKSHRHLDGRKMYKLHPLDGPGQTIRRTTVDCLKRHGLIDSNKKFPVATYLLTGKGRHVATTLTESTILPLSAKNY